MLSLLSGLQQSLVGEGSDEEQLFSPESSLIRDGFNSELDSYLQKLKVFPLLFTLFLAFSLHNITASKSYPLSHLHLSRVYLSFFPSLLFIYLLVGGDCSSNKECY